MPVKPDIGSRGGQEYPVLRSIQTFLRQMAEGGARPAPTVLKELLQNADDAGATDVSFILDERNAERAIAVCPDYAPLCGPALLVRNNSPFRLASDVGNEDDDFTSLCDVAGGHKRAQATAAGRFGIGFNSVYFLTDCPLIFSRREIHIFDLLHRIFEENGWRFPLEHFPQNSGAFVGPVKQALDWCLPVAALQSESLGNIARDPRGDFQQTVFRLPLRQSPEGTPTLYDDRFTNEESRQRLVLEMAEEAVHSIHFLKNICKISFSVLRERSAEEFVRVEATPCPKEFRDFLGQIKELANEEHASAVRVQDCAFDRIITRWDLPRTQTEKETVKTWRFHFRHTARFDDARLAGLRQKLKRNGERAIPWGAIAIPLDLDSVQLSGGPVAKWRVFLPLLEDGPCACVVSGAFFVGPSRQRLEYRPSENESDEGKRKTEWNQQLVKSVVVPLLRDVSLEIPERARELLNHHPKEYLSLFPPTATGSGEPETLAKFACGCFSAEMWHLRLRDVWDDPFDLWVGDADNNMFVELVPEWLLGYRERFRELREQRKFVRYALGDALSARVSSGGITVRRPVAVDVALLVLRHAQMPMAQDVERLLRVVIGSDEKPHDLEGAWAFQRQGSEELLRFDGKNLYVLDEHAPDSIIGVLRNLPLTLETIQWVRSGVGLASLVGDIRPALANVVNPTADAAIELLRRLPATNSHDQVSHAYEIKPVVDFLVEQVPARLTSDIRLGFLVRTAHAQSERRRLGIILLKSALPTAEDDALWEIWLRRVFAHVDKGFENELRRLLKAHPESLDLLHADDCRVIIARAQHVLGMLHDARVKQPSIMAKLDAEMADANQKHPEKASQVAAVLLDIANRDWAGMEVAQQYTVLALPIHRCSDGSYVGLLPPVDGDATDVPQQFRLQSQDDIEDAPIKTSTYRLLQTTDSSVKRFYRQRLGIKVHGRVEALKDTLRQIGEPERDNSGMLRYVVRYYDATLRELDQSGDPSDRDDAVELRSLMLSARTVPCLDETWRTAQECSEAWQMADHLAVKGWPRKRLRSLLLQLLPSEHIASIDPKLRELLPRLHSLSSWDTRKIVELAVSSESAELDLKDRFKLFLENRRDFPEAGVRRSEAAGRLHVPTLVGTTPMAESEVLVGNPNLSMGVLALLAPRAINPAKLAKEMELSPQDLPEVLRAFQVNELAAQDLNDRLVDRFGEVWSGLAQDQRMPVLSYVGTHGLEARLTDTAKALETVMVGSRKTLWKTPETVISPGWTRKRPPHVAEEIQSALHGVATAVVEVWDEWCGVRSFGDVFALVLAGASGAGAAKRSAEGIYDWVEKVAGPSPSDEDLNILKSRAWVLAQRGGDLEFRKPEEILLHQAEKILGSRFWVPALPLSTYFRRRRERLGFLTMLAATPDELGEIGECLVERAGVERSATVQVYELVGQLLEQSESLREQWQGIAKRRPVYCTFRDKERPRTSVQLFIGDSEYREDLSASLLCLKSGASPPMGLINHYRNLGLENRPTVVQVLAALGALTESEPSANVSYSRLLSALQKLADNDDAAVEINAVASMHVLTCAGTYEPIARSYWDDVLGQNGRVIAEHASLLIDTANQPTRRMVDWLRHRHPGVINSLRTGAHIESADVPVPVSESHEISDLLLPWRQWLKEVARPESALRSGLAELGVTPITYPNGIVPVEKILLRCHLQNGTIVEQSPSWEGPIALAAPDGRLLVRIHALKAGRRTESDWIGDLDRALAREVGRFLGGITSDGDGGPLVEKILKTLERPTTVLRRLRENYRENFLHQYHDQVADPEFAELFDEFQRTDPAKSRAGELKAQMFERLVGKFVQARREQIRGYGYDEFSVFAELLQNAEDAYFQREQLGMEMPKPCRISFRYINAGEGRVLEVEHQGRPFNYWQHGARQDWKFSKDVEGVLRSAGSFKPYSDTSTVSQANAAAIGRFGLGFKSVYLLTDCPEIHSEAWHFAIEAGCLPKELPSPRDMADGVTRIRLPLRVEAEDLKDVSQLVDLLPFLRKTSLLEFHPLIGEMETVEVVADKTPSSNEVIVRHVELKAPGVVRGNALRLLRCQSSTHQGQLAMLLAQDGAPTRWDEAFHHDLYAALPLRARLGCGVAASHRFEVQSGRTHLVDPKANLQKVTEVASLIEGLVEGLRTCASATVTMSELLRRFWAVWRWERGDEECEGLRRALAVSLAGLAERALAVPTLDPANPVSLKQGPFFYFSELPDAFRNAVVVAQVTIRAGGYPVTALATTKVVVEGFATAYRRTCDYAGESVAKTLVCVGWNEIAEAFRERGWFAEKPELLSCLAGCLSEDQSRKAGEWIVLCQVLAEGSDGSAVHMLPSELLSADFPGKQNLPRRFLNCVSPVYDEASVELLGYAGLRQQPRASDIREWVQSKNFNGAEAVGILKYLLEDKRFMSYRDLADVFRASWFPDNARRISTKEAAERKLIPGDLLLDPLFRAWLGFSDPIEDEPPPQPPAPDPRVLLGKLFEWWRKEGALWTKRYEERLYPAGRLPVLGNIFFAKDLSDRREWISLLLLASMHSMGRTQLQQHRNFLSRCDDRGWLDVFADGEHDARRWMEVLENYLEDPTGSHDYYQWMKQFVVIFQISRWLPEYVETFLAINRVTEPFALDQIIAPRTSAFYSGGGPDAPALTRALGLGACFVLRELTRLGILKQELAHRHCYVPVRKVCAILEAIGCSDLQSLPASDRSTEIYQFLVTHMNEERATFGRDFDLPILALSEDVELQTTLCGRPLTPNENSTNSGVEFRTRWDGVVFPVYR